MSNVFTLPTRTIPPQDWDARLRLMLDQYSAPNGEGAAISIQSVSLAVEIMEAREKVDPEVRRKRDLLLRLVTSRPT
jgi:hypothetical protein